MKMNGKFEDYRSCGSMKFMFGVENLELVCMRMIMFVIQELQIFQQFFIQYNKLCNFIIVGVLYDICLEFNLRIICIGIIKCK